MRLRLKNDLPFVDLQVGYGEASLTIPEVLIDTGSASTILAADWVERVGIVPQPEDRLYLIRGIGGNEVVFSRRVAYLQVGQYQLPHFEVEVGGMDYGFEINGIMGMDFLVQSKARLDLGALIIEFQD
jgi:hypothetical protein